MAIQSQTETHVQIGADSDIVSARQKGRELAQLAGFSGSDLTVIATAISEVARNIVEYAKRGNIRLSLITNGTQRGIMVIARDEGPGIADVNVAMQDGYTTGKGLGLGLPGARRLMDEFDIVSKVDHGTTVTMKKWNHER